MVFNFIKLLDNNGLSMSVFLMLLQPANNIKRTEICLMSRALNNENILWFLTLSRSLIIMAFQCFFLMLFQPANNIKRTYFEKIFSISDYLHIFNCSSICLCMIIILSYVFVVVFFFASSAKSTTNCNRYQYWW